MQIIPKEKERTILVDAASSSTTYVGIGKLGSDESQAVWQIFRINTASNVTKVQFADSNENFDNVWADRASLTYAD